MLHYLGPNMGPQGPVGAQLPPATPGTMPQGVPGVPPNPAPIPPAQIHAPRASTPLMHPAASPHPGAPLHALAAILRHSTPGPEHMAPPHPEYGTETQSDGSILLHVKGPNGSKGPVVKVIPAIKKAAPSGPQ